MKFFAFIFIALAFISASAYGEETCKTGNKVLKRGEVYYPPGECTELKCIGIGLLPTICPSIAAPPQCKLIPQDDTKKFPDCCPVFDCK